MQPRLVDLASRRAILRVLVLCATLCAMGCRGPANEPEAPTGNPAMESAAGEALIQGESVIYPTDDEGSSSSQGSAKENDGEGATQLAADGDQEDDEWTAESVHGIVTDRVRQTANWLDSFLVDDRFLAEQNQSTVTLRTDMLIEEHDGASFDMRVKARLVLPRTEEKLHFVASGYDTDEEELGEERLPEEVSGSSDPQLSMQYFLKATDRNNVRGEVGMRFNGLKPNPYLGARWRHSINLGTWDARGYQRFRYYAEELWESQTTIDFERLLGDSFFFRATTTGSYYELEPGYFYGQYFTLYNVLKGGALFTYEWNNTFRTEPTNELVETQLRVRYAQRVFTDWILFEVAPQLTWPEEIDYKPAMGLLFRFEFLFGARNIEYNSPLHITPDSPEYDERYDR
jgi:hypothetical protein